MVKTEMKCFISSSEIYMHISKLQVWVLYSLKSNVETLAILQIFQKGKYILFILLDISYKIKAWFCFT